MRISTSQIYDQNIRSIMNNQEDLVKTQQQLRVEEQVGHSLLVYFWMMKGECMVSRRIDLYVEE